MDRFILTRDSAALMVVDIQERLVPVIAQKEQLIKKTNILLAAADALAIPAFLTEQYPKGLGKTIAEIRRQERSCPVFEKTTFSAYTPDLAAHVKALQRTKIIIAGLETHVCVLQTARDLLAAGYQVFIAEDAVYSRAEANKTNGLRLMSQMGAVITNTETIIFDLLKESATAEFKLLSQLIK